MDLRRPVGLSPGVRPVAAALCLAGVLLSAGCVAATSGTGDPPAGDSPGTVVGTPEAGRTAASQTTRFQPRRIRLPGGASASVRPATTRRGELQVPEDVAEVGWWDGSAEPGDPFGHTVLAGHVDSATQGLGFFVRLLDLTPGDRVRLAGDGHRAAYRVVSVRAVDRDALALGSDAFDQRGPHRLVLLTCTGSYDPGRGGYSENLVVTAVPVGSVR